jgi:hypothetical protein
MTVNEIDAELRSARWTGRKAKHRKDQNHGKSGWVGGNPRYNRRKSGNDQRPHRTRPVPGEAP